MKIILNVFAAFGLIALLWGALIVFSDKEPETPPATLIEHHKREAPYESYFKVVAWDGEWDLLESGAYMEYLPEKWPKHNQCDH